MSETRVYELAQELEMDNKDLIMRLEELNIVVKSHLSKLAEDEVERVRKEIAPPGERKKIVEKRVKTTVIRRRVLRPPAEEVKPPEVKTEPVAESEKEAAVVQKEPVGEVQKEPAGVVQKEKPVTESLKETAAEEKKEPIAEIKKVSGKTEKEIVKTELGKKVPEKRVVPHEEKAPVKPTKEVKGRGKGKQAVAVVTETDAARKKGFVKQRFGGKKGKRFNNVARQVSWKGDKKEAAMKMKKTEITVPKAIKRRIKVTEAIVVGDLAKKMGVKASEVMAKLISLGIMATINQSIDFDIATLVASELGYQVEQAEVDYSEVMQEIESSPENLKPRAPVVTIMGHVDHGKTSLLDAIRETNVIAGESGGITQAIGAYHVHINDRDIVFVDTPGHEAFTAMRARGAQVTDIAVLVVAADDGVMEQTVEAINHARAADVPIMVAINKIDKPGADTDRIKQQLSDYGLIPEAWGGDAIYAEVSAKQRTGIEDLLELILLQADIMELKADPDKRARGIIIESKLDKGRGPVATVIIQEGMLREGDTFVSKAEYGRVRAMINDKGERLKEAGPSIPVEVVGFSSVPQAGTEFVCVDDEKTARNIAEQKLRKERERELSKSTKITLEQLFDRIKEGGKELNVIIKGDVQGSIEALADSLLKQSTDEVTLNIIHSSTGTITETDVMLASASDAIVIGFKVRPDARVALVAEKEGVEVKLYDVIYNVISEVRAAMEGLLEPGHEETVQGHAEARQLFKVPKLGNIAGCYVSDGKITRNSNLRLLRDGIVIYEGKVLSLKRFKEDAREVLAGFECGIGIEGFNDIKVGDVIESYIMEEVQRKLE